MITQFLSHVISVIPELVLVVGTILTLVISLWRKKGAFSFVSHISIGLLCVTGFLLFEQPSVLAPAFNGLLVSNGYTIFIKELVLLATIMVLLLALGHERDLPEYRPELPALMLLSVAGMMVLISANDLLTFYVGLELQSLCLYIMAAMRKDTINSSEAALKYFVLGALASGLFLFGASMVYGFSGTTNFTQLYSLYHLPTALLPLGVLIGVILILIALFFKVSAVPFHMWTPDVYQGVPTIVTTFFAAVPKAAMIGFILRFVMGPLQPLADQWQQVMIFVSAASMIVGALAALRQNNVKRLLAYSSIGHVGYALMGVASASAKGIQGVLIYLSLYIFMTLGMFGCVLMMRKQDRTGAENYGYSDSISEWAGLGYTHPFRAAFISIFMLSMAGIPPFAGFFAKFYIFVAAIDAKLYPLVIIGAASSVIAAFYYIRIIKVMYFDEGKGLVGTYSPLLIGLVVLVSAIINLLYFVLPTPLLSAVGQAAKVLLP